jgi:hypothetical protein
MSDPDPSAAVRAAFLDVYDAALTGVARAYDEVPSNRSWPALILRAVQVIPDDGDCLNGSEIYLDFDAWSKVLDHSETVAIAGIVRRTPFAIQGHVVIIQELVSVQFTGDPDPNIARAALSLRLETEPA